MIESPYITRSKQELGNVSGKRELFEPSSEQARRSIMDGITKDVQSTNIKDNLRVLGVLQNLNILSIKKGSSLDAVSAPIPGTDVERSLGNMLRSGDVKPSLSMLDIADRHGIEIPPQDKTTPNPALPENSKDMLKMAEPTKGVELENAPLRNVTSQLMAEHNKKGLEVASAYETLNKAISTIFSPKEKELGGLEKFEDNMSTKPKLPWEKDTKKPEDKEVNPMELFNQAAEKLAKLGKKEQEAVLSLAFESPLLKALKTGMDNILGKDNPSKPNGTTLLDFAKDPLGSYKTLLKEALQPLTGVLNPPLQKLNKVLEETLDTDNQEFLKDPFSAVKKAVDKKDNRRAEKTNSLIDEPAEKEAKKPKETLSKTDSKITSLFTKAGPGMESIKAGMEVFQALTSKKEPGEKMMDVGKAATKAVVTLAKGAGTKVLAGALATPAAPLAAALMVIGTVLKVGLDLIGKDIEGPAGPTAAGQTPQVEQKKEETAVKDDTAEKNDVFESAINTFMPNVGGKKGLALKGLLKTGGKGIQMAKEDGNQDIASEKSTKQKQDTPDLSMG